MAEIHFPETLTLTTDIRHIGNASFVCGQALFRHEECVGYCEATLVYTLDGKPAPIPDDARTIIRRHQIEMSLTNLST